MHPDIPQLESWPMVHASSDGSRLYDCLNSSFSPVKAAFEWLPAPNDSPYNTVVCDLLPDVADASTDTTRAVHAYAKEFSEMNLSPNPIYRSFYSHMYELSTRRPDKQEAVVVFPDRWNTPYEERLIVPLDMDEARLLLGLWERTNPFKLGLNEGEVPIPVAAAGKAELASYLLLFGNKGGGASRTRVAEILGVKPQTVSNYSNEVRVSLNN